MPRGVDRRCRKSILGLLNYSFKWITVIHMKFLIFRTKKVELEIEIPAKYVTTLAFGGPQLDELFVATANIGTQEPPAGALFKVTGLGVRGLPMTKMVLKD